MKISMDGSIVTPSKILKKVYNRKLSRADLEDATWAVETPQATLELSYEYSNGEIVELEIDLVELDEDFEWHKVREGDVTVKFCFLRIGHSEWELELDGLDEEEDIKRPDSLSFTCWTEGEEIDFGELEDDWEEVHDALEDLDED